MAVQLRLGPTKGGRARRRKYEDDRLLPIRGDRLRVAINRAELTVAGFARTHHLQQQTLDYIVRGKTKRCRGSLVARLSHALAVPEDWLTGEIDVLDRADGAAFRTAEADRYVAAFPLAWRALIDQVHDVAHREQIPRATRDRIEYAILHLTNPRMWTWTLFGLDPRKSATEHGPVAQYNDTGRLRSAASVGAELDDWIRATLADVLSAILLPWFRNEATLNVRALCAAAPRPPKPRQPRAASSTASTRRARARRSPASSRKPRSSAR